MKILEEAEAAMFAWELKCHDIFRQIASVYVVEEGETLKGRREKNVNEAVWDASDEITGCDEVDEVVKIKPHKLATIVTVPMDVKETFEELQVQDGKEVKLFNEARYRSYIFSKAAAQIGTAEERAFILGDGYNKPIGVAVSMCDSFKPYKIVTSSGAESVTVDSIINLFYRVEAKYRDRGVWLMSDSTLAHLRKLEKFSLFSGVVKEKDASGAYAYETILGRPVITSKYMPVRCESEDGTKSEDVFVAFGDFSAYKIVETGKTYVQEVKGWRNDIPERHIYKTTTVKYTKLMSADGEPERYYFEMYVGGKLVEPEAVKICSTRHSEEDYRASWKSKYNKH